MADMVKRAFLRACINHGCLSQQQIDQILTPLCKQHKVAKPSGSDEFKKFLKSIENDIKEFNQTVKLIKHPITNEEYLVYAITDTPNIKGRHPELSDVDCVYFSALLDKIVQEEEYKLIWNDAYTNFNFDDGVSPPKKQRMEELLQQWCNVGYFMEQGDFIYLGPRTMVEFEYYLRTHYKDNIHACSLCKDLVFWDVKCNNCEAKLHRPCIRKYLRLRSNCPSCEATWTTRLSI